MSYSASTQCFVPIEYIGNTLSVLHLEVSIRTTFPPPMLRASFLQSKFEPTYSRPVHAQGSAIGGSEVCRLHVYIRANMADQTASGADQKAGLVRRPSLRVLTGAESNPVGSVSSTSGAGVASSATVGPSLRTSSVEIITQEDVEWWDQEAAVYQTSIAADRRASRSPQPSGLQDADLAHYRSRSAMLGAVSRRC